MYDLLIITAILTSGHIYRIIKDYQELSSKLNVVPSALAY